MCSEYIHKGPRSRKKEEEKNVEGGENIDGMIAETTLVTCNHVTPVASKNDVDTVSVVSADRSSTDSVRACGLCAHAEGFSILHDAYNEADIGYGLNGDVVKVNGSVHLGHDNDVDVVDSGVDVKTCMLPKSKSSSAIKSQLYPVVDKASKNNAAKVGNSYERESPYCKETGLLNGSLNDEIVDNTRKSNSEAEVDQHGKDEIGSHMEETSVQGIKSPSLRNLLQSFIGKIDKLSPKKEGNDIFTDKEDNNIKSIDAEGSELMPLLFTADDSGLASAPSFKLQHETPAGSGSVFCPSCGLKQSDMSDISLESFGRTSSLKSYNSLKSDRMKSLSRNSGPIIQIVPEELTHGGSHGSLLRKANTKSIKPLEKLVQTGLTSIPRQTVINHHNEGTKIGYIAFSSFDTETSSVPPSTSVSNDSLQSAADDLTSDQSAMDTSPRSPDQVSDKSRNVAIDSLRNAKYGGKSLKERSPDLTDSGFNGSLKLDSEAFKGANNEKGGRLFKDQRNRRDVLQNGEVKSRKQMQQKMQVVGSGLDKRGAFKSMDVKRKRQSLRQSHSCGHIDLSD